ncbi:hypothetical protein ACNF42_08365 [Cuniculiplasma sp. SKW3]|uniref:hypothetical protein n=1 Tax=unclassified Cuniculiplasma TaxID=2619706 RepID=UPI003FD58EAE
MPISSRRKVDKIVAKRRESNNLRNIPDVLVPLWQVKIRERFGINIDREIARYIVMAAHEEGTWKKQRAMQKIEAILIERGVSKEDSIRISRNVINIVVGGGNNSD